MTTKPTVAAEAVIELAERVGLSTVTTRYVDDDAVRIYVSIDSPISDLIVTWGDFGTLFLVDEQPSPIPLSASHAAIRLRNMARLPD